MIEITFAERYQYGGGGLWNLKIELTRTSLKWNFDTGFSMSGTWSGKIPQNGLYKFHPRTRAKFYGMPTNALKDVDILMICTFQSDGTWEAIDWPHNNEIPTWITRYDNQSTNKPLKFPFEQFFIDNKILVNPTFTQTMTTNQLLVVNKFVTFEDGFKYKDDVLGGVTCYGLQFFTNRDTLNTSTSMPSTKLMLLNPFTVDASSVLRSGSWDNPTYAVTLVNLPSTDTSGKPDGVSDEVVRAKGWTAGAYRIGAIPPLVGDHTGVFYSFPAFTMDGAGGTRGDIKIEGSLGEFEDSIIRDQPEMREISINYALDPRQGYHTTYQTTAPYTGYAYVVQDVDIYEQKTTLKGIKLYNV